jgi:serine/threonine protein kinase/streptogramin lyase
MSEPQDPSAPSAFAPPVSAFTGPVAELIAQRMLLPPSRPGLLAVLDHFEILRILGGGGMGIVLLARDSRNGRDVAVKLIKTELVTNQQVVHRFLKEAGHLKRLRHTNIVPVDEISEKPEAPYFVMPYFEKGSLANRMKPGQPLDAATILDIAMQVAEGLSFAHRSGIIHRDLKPANILVGAGDRICIADFGLARTVFNDSIVDVESRQLEGTAPYMSPGVAAGDAEDTRCDTYSFGALLYEMLAGHPPYTGRSTREILNQILAGPPKPILSLNPAADRALVKVAEKAMARELRDRYADMRDIIRDLQSIKDGKPAGAQPGSPIVLRLLLAVGVLIVLLVLYVIFHPRSSQLVATSPAPPPPQQTVTPTPPVKTPAPAPPVVAPVPAPPPAPVPVTITLAGQPGVKGYADGPSATAQFRLPNNIAVDHSGNIYVADTANDVIRKITPDGTVSTLAGLARTHGSADGLGGNARFWAPFGIAVDAAGNVFVADTANNTIRKISPGGIVSTFAGLAGSPGYADGTNSAARFRNPWGVAVDNADGDVFVADMSNDTIRRITPAGGVFTVAGQPGVPGISDGFGNDARFDNPFAVAVDSAGDVYVSDSANNAIRKITHRVVTTLAGLPGLAGNTDGNGASARFWNPQGLAVDSTGNVYVADTGNNLIRKITPMGVVTTITIPPDSAGKPVQLSSPGGVALDAAGNLYIADTSNHCLRKIAPGK